MQDTEQDTEQVTPQDIEQVTPQDTPQVEQLLKVIKEVHSRNELQERLFTPRN